MKLNVTDLRYISSDEFRILTAVEMGTKNHEVVPNSLIVQVAGLRSGGVNKLLGELAKRKLVAKVQSSKYDGYRLTNGGYDYLALRALSKRDSVFSVGNQIGVGKESDIYVVADAHGSQMALKLHRLGRISFRAIKEKRDYLGKRKSASWMYLSRLSAQKEWTFLKALHEHGFPVPTPVDQTRHCVLMELIDGLPLRQIIELPSPGKLYAQLMDLITKFARAGLIHGDFNEFNILIHHTTGEPVVIDFPQMISMSHENAEWYFERDVECIRTFFRRQYNYESDHYPRFRREKADAEANKGIRLDAIVAASGFGRESMRVLEEHRMENRTSYGSEEGEGEAFDDSSLSEDEDDSSEGSEVQEVDLLPQGKVRTISVADDCQVSDICDNNEETSDGDSGDVLANVVHDMQSVQLHGPNDSDMRKHVASDLIRDLTKEKEKFHSKNSRKKAGRQRGSKAKQDLKYKFNADWD